MGRERKNKGEEGKRGGNGKGEKIRGIGMEMGTALSDTIATLADNFISLVNSFSLALLQFS